jgi:hypothetical protein
MAFGAGDAAFAWAGAETLIAVRRSLFAVRLNRSSGETAEGEQRVAKDALQ